MVNRGGRGQRSKNVDALGPADPGATGRPPHPSALPPDRTLTATLESVLAGLPDRATHSPSAPFRPTLAELLPDSLLAKLIELTALGVGEYPADPIPPLPGPAANRFPLGPHLLAEGLRGDLAGPEPGAELHLRVHDGATGRDVFLTEGAQFGQLIVRELKPFAEPHDGFGRGAGPGWPPAGLSGERRGTEYGQRQQCDDAW